MLWKEGVFLQFLWRKRLLFFLRDHFGRGVKIRTFQVYLPQKYHGASTPPKISLHGAEDVSAQLWYQVSVRFWVRLFASFLKFEVVANRLLNWRLAARVASPPTLPPSPQWTRKR